MTQKNGGRRFTHGGASVAWTAGATLKLREAIVGRTDDGLLTANWRILDNTTVHVK